MGVAENVSLLLRIIDGTFGQWKTNRRAYMRRDGPLELPDTRNDWQQGQEEAAKQSWLCNKENFFNADEGYLLLAALGLEGYPHF